MRGRDPTRGGQWHRLLPARHPRRRFDHTGRGRRHERGRGVFPAQLYRAATETYHGYYTANGTTALEGWTNTNGSPIPGLDDPGTEYAFNSAPYSPSCLDPAACNYDPASPGNLDCQYPDAGLDCNGDCLADDDGDGVCNDDEVDGCTDSTACNYDPDATDDDGSCQTLDACGVCGGPGLAPGTCDCAGNVADAIGVCGGDCAADADADGICDDVDPCVGNYDACGLCNGPGAIYDCGCEDIPAGDCDCDGNQLDAAGVCGGDCTEDADGDGVCDDEDACIGTVDACGICNGPGAIYGCGCEELPEGDCDCNGNVEDAIGVCGGTCAEDLDGDGICDDSDPCIGTEDACGACDGPGAIYDCGCSDIPEGDCDCNGNQLDALGVCGRPCAADADGDGLCDDVDDCVGDYDACGVCNGPGAVYECGCEDIPAGDCDCNGNQLDALGVCGGTCAGDQDADGVCDDAEILGCTDDTACNYAASATEEDGSCTYPPALYDCAGDCPGRHRWRRHLRCAGESGLHGSRRPELQRAGHRRRRQLHPARAAAGPVRLHRHPGLRDPLRTGDPRRRALRPRRLDRRV